MNEEQHERGLKLRVGVFVVVALVVFLGMIYLLGARAHLFESRYTIHADFTEVGGLTEGATVRLAGVQIGRVTGVHLPGQPGGKVRIDMRVGTQFSDRIRKDSVARIETQGLLGDRLVEITVGTAAAPRAAPGEVIASRDPTDLNRVLGQSAETVRNVAALAESLRATAETLNQSRIVEGAAATVAAARTVTEQVGRDAATTAATVRQLAERVGQEVTATASTARGVAERASRVIDRVESGPGLAHTLLYDEPVALGKVNELIARTDEILARLQRGEGALGVLTSEQSGAAARRLVAAMERFGRIGQSPPENGGLLPSLLFDPKYRALLDDLRVTSRNLREVTDRLAGGRGTLGSLLGDQPGAAGIQQASRDLQAAMANLRAITEKVNQGEGTLGALIADPTLYERLSAVLDGASRSFLLRSLIKGLGREPEK